MSLWGWLGVGTGGVEARRGGRLMIISMIRGRRQERTMTYGRKLQAEGGRCATNVKISEIRRCCTLVS